MKVSASDWRSKRELLSSGTKGWHYQERFPELLKEHIPELRKFKFGYCDEEGNDISEWMAMGWIPLTRDLFEPEEFNKVIGFRYEVKDTDGRMKLMNNYVMIKPIDFAKDQQDMRNATARRYQDAVIGGTSAPDGVEPGDVTAKLEQDHFSVNKKKPGRPPGSKNKKKKKG